MDNTLTDGNIIKKPSRMPGWQWICVALFAAIVRIPDFCYPMRRDSGLFAYGGWRILHGALPYRDFWDNKLPGVFYINALAIRLFGANTAAFVVFQMMYMAVTACLFMAVARRFCRQPIALIVTLLFAFYHSSFGIGDGGNYTETYIALPMLASVLLMLNWSKERKGYAVPFISGLLISVAAFIKQPAASLAGAIVMYLIIADPKRRQWKAAASVIAGVAVFGLLVVVWFIHKGILHDARDANIVFNRLYFLDAYSKKGLIGAKWNVLRGVNLTALPMIGAIGGIITTRLRAHRVFWLLVPWFFFDLIGLCMGGRFFNHYFLAILPSTFLLTGICLNCLVCSSKTLVITTITGLALFFGPVWQYNHTPGVLMADLPICSVAETEFEGLKWIFTRRIPLGVKAPSEDLGEWLKLNTDKTDYVYVWGWETRVAFLANRQICSRYLHSHPLGATGFNREARIRELANSIREHRPKYVIDTSVFMPTTTPPLDGSPHAPEWSPFFALDGYEPVFKVIAQYYDRVDTIDGCPIYERKP